MVLSIPWMVIANPASASNGGASRPGVLQEVVMRVLQGAGVRGPGLFHRLKTKTFTMPSASLRCGWSAVRATRGTRSRLRRSAQTGRRTKRRRFGSPRANRNRRALSNYNISFTIARRRRAYAHRQQPARRRCGITVTAREKSQRCRAPRRTTTRSPRCARNSSASPAMEVHSEPFGSIEPAEPQAGGMSRRGSGSPGHRGAWSG